MQPNGTIGSVEMKQRSIVVSFLHKLKLIERRFDAPNGNGIPLQAEIVDSSPLRAAGILIFGALATPVIAAVWIYWGAGWGLVAWASSLPLALIPWGIDATRRTLAQRSRRRRRATRGTAAAATRARGRPRKNSAGNRLPGEPVRSRRSGSSAGTG